MTVLLDPLAKGGFLTLAVDCPWDQPRERPFLRGALAPSTLPSKNVTLKFGKWEKRPMASAEAQGWE